MRRHHPTLVLTLCLCAQALAFGAAGAGTLPCEGVPPLEVSPPGSPEPLRFLDPQMMVWEDGAASCSTSFQIYRGDLDSLTTGFYSPCYEDAVTASSTSDDEEPLEGQVFYYMVSGENAAGEGTLGGGWAGARTNQIACDRSGLEVCDNGIDDDGDGQTDCLDSECADQLVCAATVCECTPSCSGLNPEVQVATSDLPGLVRDWTATLSVDATDPTAQPLSYDWSTDCPALLTPAGPTAGLTGVAVPAPTHCRVTVSVTNPQDWGRTCSIPMTINPGRAIPQEQVHVVLDDPAFRLQHADDASMHFYHETPGDVPSLLPGNFLVVAQPGGGIRQIVGGYFDENNIYVVDTLPAVVEDIVLETKFDEVVELQMIGGGAGSRSSTPAPSCSPDFSNPPGVEAESGVSVGFESISLTFTPTATVKGSVGPWYDPKLKSAEISADGSLTMQSGVGLSVGAGIEADASADLVNCSRWFTFTIGVIPVVTELVLALEAGIEVNAEASIGVTQDLIFNGSAKAGVTYSQSNGWQPLTQHTQSFSAPSPSFAVTDIVNASANATVFMGPRLEVNLYGVVGPFVTAHGYLAAEAQVSGTSFTWDIPAGFRADLGGQVNLFGAGTSFSMLLWQHPLGSLASGSGTVDAEGHARRDLDGNGPCLQRSGRPRLRAGGLQRLDA